MNAPTHHLTLQPDRGPEEVGSRPALPAALAPNALIVWESKFGTMVIEVRDGVAFVNGEAVERFGDKSAPA